jgi:hypothetical protein
MQQGPSDIGGAMILGLFAIGFMTALVLGGRLAVARLTGAPMVISRAGLASSVFWGAVLAVLGLAGSQDPALSLVAAPVMHHTVNLALVASAVFWLIERRHEPRVVWSSVPKDLHKPEQPGTASHLPTGPSTQADRRDGVS